MMRIQCVFVRVRRGRVCRELSAVKFRRKKQDTVAGSVRQWVWYECSGDAALDADASGCRADSVNDGLGAG